MLVVHLLILNFSCGLFLLFPTSSSAHVRYALFTWGFWRLVTFVFDLLNWKLAHCWLLPWGTFPPILVFLHFLVIELGVHRRPTSLPGKFYVSISRQQVVRSTSCLVHGLDFGLADQIALIFQHWRVTWEEYTLRRLRSEIFLFACDICQTHRLTPQVLTRMKTVRRRRSLYFAASVQCVKLPASSASGQIRPDVRPASAWTLLRALWLVDRTATGHQPRPARIVQCAACTASLGSSKMRMGVRSAAALTIPARLHNTNIQAVTCQ